MSKITLKMVAIWRERGMMIGEEQHKENLKTKNYDSARTATIVKNYIDAHKIIKHNDECLLKLLEETNG